MTNYTALKVAVVLLTTLCLASVVEAKQYTWRTVSGDNHWIRHQVPCEGGLLNPQSTERDQASVFSIEDINGTPVAVSPGNQVRLRCAEGPANRWVRVTSQNEVAIGSDLDDRRDFTVVAHPQSALWCVLQSSPSGEYLVVQYDRIVTTRSLKEATVFQFHDWPPPSPPPSSPPCKRSFGTLNCGGPPQPSPRGSDTYVFVNGTDAALNIYSIVVGIHQQNTSCTALQLSGSLAPGQQMKFIVPYDQKLWTRFQANGSGGCDNKLNRGDFWNIGEGRNATVPVNLQ